MYLSQLQNKGCTVKQILVPIERYYKILFDFQIAVHFPLQLEQKISDVCR